MKKWLTAALLTCSSSALFANTLPETDSIVYQDKSVLVTQFTDAGLAHFSYAILANGQVIIVDPGRDPEIYLAFARQKNARITGVIETHPHADFASSHNELHKVTGARIYTCSLIKPGYAYSRFDENDHIDLGGPVALRSIFTPGHAPDAISAILTEDGKDIAVFSGDALLIGDVGRPDLRSYSGDIQSQREVLARKMYHTLWEKFALLNDNVLLFPTHGAGSLCGKAMRKANLSTIGYERANNYAFQIKDEEVFVKTLLADLPTIPKYFPYDVALNVNGVPDFRPSVKGVPLLPANKNPDTTALIVDGRAEQLYKQSYLRNAINIQDGKKFETWLGSVVGPEQRFYVTAENEAKLKVLIEKAAKIGYESKILGAFVYNAKQGDHFTTLDTTQLNVNAYTIIDVRTQKEAHDNPLFPGALNIPLDQLSNRVGEIPAGKPILVHCESGYRSATGSSIIKKYLPDAQVFDLGTAVKSYERKH